MSLKLKINGEPVNFKVTLGSLFKAQKALGKSGLIDLAAGLEIVDLETTLTLLAFSADRDLEIEELFECDIDLIKSTEFLVAEITELMQGGKKGKKSKAVQGKK
jgi:hypothetical protein